MTVFILNYFISFVHRKTKECLKMVQDEGLKCPDLSNQESKTQFSCSRRRLQKQAAVQTSNLYMIGCYNQLFI